MAEANRRLDELLEEALVLEAEQPYELPENWVWVRLITINEKESKTVDPRQNPNYKYELYSVPSFEFNQPEILKGIDIKSSKVIVQPNDVLLCKINPKINRVWNVSNFTNNIKIASSEWIVIRQSKINFRYLVWALRANYFRNLICSNVSGVGGSLTRSRPKDVGNYPIPIAPLKEQERIVNKIENMIIKIKEVRELIQEAKELLEFRRASILHKAFTGELTEKWRRENDIVEGKVYYEIIKEQRLNVANGAKEVKELEESFNTFDLNESMMSNGWVKFKASMVCHTITCGNTPTNKITSTGQIPFLKVYNIVNNRINFEYKPQFIDKETHDRKLKSSKLLPNDVVMNIVGPPLRKIAIIPEDYDEWNMNQAIVRFRTINYVDSKFVYYCLLNNETLDDVIAETKGVVGQANISITQSRNLIFPIPSIEEQKEIVHILDNIFGNEVLVQDFLDLEDQIDLIEKSILSKAFKGELGTRSTNDEPAIELIKKILTQKGDKLQPKENSVKRVKVAKENNSISKDLLSIMKRYKRISPDNLYTESGFDIDKFYRELKELVDKGKARQIPDRASDIKNVILEYVNEDK